MDILAHGLWTAAGALTAKKKLKNKMRVGLAAFYGVFPDLFSFTVLTVWYATQLLTGKVSAGHLPEPSEIEPSSPDTLWIFRLTNLLYGMSHSVFVFLAIAAIVFIFKRRVVWEMAGWLFHIGIDVFTHSYSFYPTPVLWPVSSWRFNGLSWETPWFMAVNYAALLLLYLFFIKKSLLSVSEEGRLRFLGKRLTLKPVSVSDKEE